MKKSMTHFTQLETWKVAHGLVLALYRASEHLPKKEMYGLISQMTRAATSITSNIAEGFGRKSYKEKCRFYYISKGSLLELENQLIIAMDLNYLTRPIFNALVIQMKSVHRLLNALLKKTEEYCTTV